MSDKASSVQQPMVPTTTLSEGLVMSQPSPQPLLILQNPLLPGINSLVEITKPRESLQRIFSPPTETPMNNLAQFRSQASKTHSMTSNPISRGQAPLSPPVSPESKNTLPPPPSAQPQGAIRDPILFPANHGGSDNFLFLPDNSPETALSNSKAVEDHVAAREDSVFKALSPPQVSEYNLALEFKSHLGKALRAKVNRHWAQRELAQLKEDNLLRSAGRGKQHSSIAPASGARSKTKKTQATRSSAGKSSKTNSGTRISKTSRGRKTSGRGKTPDPSKKASRDDKDFNSITDYSPPTSSLPDKPNSLKVDWKGNAIDLTNDPFLKLLHPDEVQLAANLRLDCATYLTSKRRIFISRIQASKIGKEFRKTDAQQACKIDVNKASKLWSAFDKVGWLNPKWLPKSS